MSGSNASPFTPLAVGTSDAGDFSSWLGRPSQSNEETYVMVQSSVAIASGSNGKQLATAVSAGQATFVVILATGGATDYLTVGAIPWALVGPIASGAYFLAVRDSSQHVMIERGTLSGSMEAGGLLVTGSGSDLINVLTGNAAPLTGAASTSSGIGTILGQLKANCGKCLTADTGVVAVSGWVQYRAPFRGAD